MLTYAPGQTSGWHVHPGVHEVTVLSGSLTIYGEDCQGRAYGPGERYVGGPTRHMALNDSAERLEMAVRWTFATDALPEVVTVPVAAPFPCDDDVRSGGTRRLDWEGLPPGGPPSSERGLRPAPLSAPSMPNARAECNLAA